MTDYRFERECRTPYSESYVIVVEDEQIIGRVDLHFTTSVVNASLSVGESMTSEEIRELINVIDEEIVLSADMPRDDFMVTVYQGREVGIFSDEEFGGETELED